MSGAETEQVVFGHQVRRPDDLRQWSEYFDKGVTHFLTGLVTPERQATAYPTLDSHTEEQEADFIAGWEHARRQHEAAKDGDRIEISETCGWRAEG